MAIFPANRKTSKGGFSLLPAPRCSKGFTLLEVLAAIALLAFAFAIGLRAMSAALGNSARGEAMTQATLEAQSLLDMQGLTDPLRAGVREGRFDDGTNWRLRTTAYRPPNLVSAGASFSAPQPASNDEGNDLSDVGAGVDLFRLDLDVNYAGTRVLHFSTLKAQVAQPPQHP